MCTLTTQAVVYFDEQRQLIVKPPLDQNNMSLNNNVHNKARNYLIDMR